MRLPTRTLRGRLALLAAGAVTLAIGLVCVSAYLVVRSNLIHSIDVSLQAPRDADLHALAHPPPPEVTGITPADLQFVVQQLSRNGSIKSHLGSATLPVTAADRRIAAGSGEQITDTHDSNGAHVRVLTASIPSGAIMVARPLTETDRTLARMRLLLLIISGAGVLGSAGIGLLVARAGIAPLHRLTEIAEEIARTERPDPPAPEEGSDELARLGRAFNAMVKALASSRDRQRHLVLDASHELRTPATVLQTNIELLTRADAQPGRLPPHERETLLRDLNAQAAELSALINELIDLAREDESDFDVAPCVMRAVERVRLRAPQVNFALDLDPTQISGVETSLERAIVNILDNAVKFGPHDQTVHVTLRDRTLTVTDEGPGIDLSDRPLVFDRFYRATTSRALPGSGLGLAIVAQSMALHGADIDIDRTATNGAAIRIRFPAFPVR
jgi:two-component system sensor histidine kinase MprB